MSRLKCDCGNILYNTSDDTINILQIYELKKVYEIIKNNPTQRFVDFECDYSDEDFEYWFCDRCNKIKKQSFETDKVVETYEYVGERKEDSIPDNTVLIFSEKDTVEIDKDEGILLSTVVDNQKNNHMYVFDDSKKAYYKIIL